MINCSLIGYGKWGKNILKALEKNKTINIKSICKKNIKKFTNTKYKNKILKSYLSAITDDIDAVFISTPSETHFKIAKYALEQKKNVFVEKPICFKNKEFNILLNLAKKNKLVLHTNYIHTFNENLNRLVKKFNKIKNLKKKNIVNIILGNDGPIRKKTSVLMDWGPHIISMINLIINNSNIKLYDYYVIQSNYKNKQNIYLNFKNKNFDIYVLFGNNFEKKTCNVEITQNGNNFTYTDKYFISQKNNKKTKRNYQKFSPLENSINFFIKTCNKKLFYSEKINEKITLKLENINSILFD